MIIERIWAANALRNFHYLIGCEESGEALAVDPLDWQRCLAAAAQRKLRITQILNTHEHHDHTGGNAPLVAATGAKLLAHAGAAARIGGVDVGLSAGDVIRVGRSVELECLDTPGHTMSHVCLRLHGDQPGLVSGDTLFNAGVGNCKNGGDPVALFETCERLLASLPDNAELHPGHEYLQNNLRFTLHVDPENRLARNWLARAESQSAEQAPVLTLGEERQINNFFRLREPAVIEGLRRVLAGGASGASGAVGGLPRLGAAPGPREVFIALRELRNRW